ncbi:MAG: asparagine--tRNA ligase [Desulfuromonadaceae bacterium]|nr:asparagine--tRNA ligase [Desulfuromonadaceae bacterium]
MRINTIFNPSTPEASPGDNIEVQGWVRTLRRSKQVCFVELNDGSTMDSLQLVIGGDLVATLPEGLGTGACIHAAGTLQASPAKGQTVELHVTRIEVLGGTTAEYPLQKKRHSFEFLRTIAHLRPRTNTFGAVFRVRSALSFAVHKFFTERGFIHVHTPIITASDCEGAGEMFRVTTLDPDTPPRNGQGEVDWSADFFAQQTSLTVSGQLQGELYALAFGNIYTFGPTFRAENSHTSRHAAEFWMIEPEMAFADLATNCEVARDFICYLIKYALEHCRADLEFFDARIEAGLLEKLQRVAEAEFSTMTYTAAVETLQQAHKTFEFPVEWGLDLQSEHERYLCEEVVKGPLFVVDYPKEIKAFYMRANADGKTVAAMDLLLPRVGEIIGGSQREERYAQLLQRMQECGVDPHGMQWYLDSRRWGGCPHAGFGMGFERFLMYVTGMDNIRDVIAFPRTPGHAEF